MQRWPVPVLGLGALLVLFAHGKLAVAEHSPTVKVTRGPRAQGCADGPTLAGRLTTARRPGFEIEVAFDGGPGAFRATLTRRDPGGTPRVLEDLSPTCDALTDGVVAALGVLLEADDDVPLDATSPAEGGAPEAAAPPASTVTPPPVPEVPRGWHPVLAVGTRGTPGVTPGLGGSLLAELALEGTSPWSVGVAVTWWPTSTVPRPPGEVGLGLTAVWLRGCARVLVFGPFAARVCGAPGVGPLAVEGRGFRDNARALRPWAGFLLEGEGRLTFPEPVRSLGLFARLGIAGTFTRPSVVVDGVGEVFRAPVLGPSLAAGLFWTPGDSGP